jgi:hypothetical protein
LLSDPPRSLTTPHFKAIEWLEERGDVSWRVLRIGASEVEQAATIHERRAAAAAMDRGINRSNGTSGSSRD